jgi:hypothetical protein
MINFNKIIFFNEMVNKTYNTYLLSNLLVICLIKYTDKNMISDNNKKTDHHVISLVHDV